MKKLTKKQKRAAILKAMALIESEAECFSCCAVSEAADPETGGFCDLSIEYANFFGGDHPVGAVTWHDFVGGAYEPGMKKQVRLTMLAAFLEIGLA
jgi:hypothetical protein